METHSFPEAPNVPLVLKKYQHAGYGLMGLNTLYLVLVFIFIPSFHLDLSSLISIVLYLGFLGVLSYYVGKGKRILTMILAVIFGMRSAYSIYALISGNAFPAVPYVLPLLLITFYLLGRAAWDWK